MFCLPVETPPAEIVRELVKSRHSRVPLYEGHRDTIVGVLYTRDLLKPVAQQMLTEPDAIEKLLREPLLIPEVKPTAELFETFRRRNLTFALTVDEYGGVTGLVTMKDLLEHIFGEIRSLSDAARLQGIEDLGDGRFAIDGELTVEDFNREMQVHLSGWHAHTVAGLVLNSYGELPPAGATVDLDELRFLVDAVDHNRIRRLIVEPMRIAQAALGEGGTPEEDSDIETSTPDSASDAPPAPLPPGAEAEAVNDREARGN